MPPDPGGAGEPGASVSWDLLRCGAAPAPVGSPATLPYDMGRKHGMCQGQTEPAIWKRTRHVEEIPGVGDLGRASTAVGKGSGA